MSNINSPSFISTSNLNKGILLANMFTPEELFKNEKLKKLLWKDFDSLVYTIKKEREELEKTNSKTLKQLRDEYINELVKTFEEKMEQLDFDSKTFAWEAKTELSKLKAKIEWVVDKDSLEWKKRAVIELMFTEEWDLGSDFNDEPFYVEDGELKTWFEPVSWLLKLLLPIWFFMWNSEVIDWLENPEKVRDNLNQAYRWVRDLIEKSEWDMKKYVWILYDIVNNPENIIKYKDELWNQPWYNDYLDRVN